MKTMVVQCWSCTLGFFTLNEVSTHHLDTHERPLPEGAGTRIPLMTPPRRRYVVPNHKAKAAQEWYGHARDGVPYA